MAYRSEPDLLSVNGASSTSMQKRPKLSAARGSQRSLGSKTPLRSRRCLSRLTALSNGCSVTEVDGSCWLLLLVLVDLGFKDLVEPPEIAAAAKAVPPVDRIRCSWLRKSGNAAVGERSVRSESVWVAPSWIRHRRAGKSENKTYREICSGFGEPPESNLKQEPNTPVDGGDLEAPPQSRGSCIRRWWYYGSLLAGNRQVPIDFLRRGTSFSVFLFCNCGLLYSDQGPSHVWLEVFCSLYFLVQMQQRSSMREASVEDFGIE